MSEIRYYIVLFWPDGIKEGQTPLRTRFNNGPLKETTLRLLHEPSGECPAYFRNPKNASRAGDELMARARASYPDCDVTVEDVTHHATGAECPEDCHGCPSCHEDNDPVRMGWVGKDGRP